MFSMIFSLLSTPAFTSYSVALAQAGAAAPTLEPSQPTAEPTQTPAEATLAPSDTPTQAPTNAPAQAPTDTPTLAPTEQPTPLLTTAQPTPAPTTNPEVVPLITPQSGGGIAGEYIVVYKPGAMAAGQISSQTTELTAQGGHVLFVYTSAIQGFAARLSPEALKTLRQNAQIDYIEINQAVQVKDVEESTAQGAQNSPPWGLDRIDQRYLPLDGAYFYPATAGAGVNVYVIDTGIRATHEEFGGRVSLDFDSVGDGYNGNDCNGHGTHVAGTIGGSTYGVAKKVNLHSVRVLNCDGHGSWSQIIAGLDWVKLHHVLPAVVNMSLGTNASTSIDAAVKAVIAHGVTVVVAAGDSYNEACEISPARVPEAITVGATDSSDTATPGPYNWGSCLDIFAPGVSITSAFNSLAVYGV